MRHAIKYMKENGQNALLCPCSRCQNLKRWKDVGDVELHLSRYGFMRDYTIWIWHGERPENSTNVVENLIDHENIRNENVMYENFDSDNVGFTENVENVECTSNDIEIDEIMSDVDNDCTYIPEILRELFKKECNVPLYPDCTKFSKLTAVFNLYNLKAKNGWSDKSFTALLRLLGDMLPEKNVLPDSTYYTKKLLCPLNMEVERIHACPNDCILYRKEHSNLNKCPTCNASRYKFSDDDDDEGDTVPNSNEKKKKKKKSPAKVIWYLPIIPRFRRLFMNPKDAKLLRWHEDSRKKDNKLRHPADGPEWRNINRKFPFFEDEPGNLRLGLCTDGMYPYGNMSSRHSTWPVMLCVYNLPPWRCMKRKYMMMSLLISRPKQPGNDIDVYLAPLIDDLQKLWKEGVEVYDANLKENFNLRAMILCTIDDYPALGNLSGYKVKCAKACVVCRADTHFICLQNYKKNVYMRHRRFLSQGHKYRDWSDEFDGQQEKEKAKPPAPVRKVYQEVKDIKVQFGKKSDNNSLKDSIWKKKFIFWDLARPSAG